MPLLSVIALTLFSSIVVLIPNGHFSIVVTVQKDCTLSVTEVGGQC
jgi:hypothetical protein